MSNTSSGKAVKAQSQYLVLALLMLLPMAGLAQPGPPPDPDVPITGIEFLLGGGALLGVRKILNHFKSNRRQ